jgi:hypothetical protein
MRAHAPTASVTTRALRGGTWAGLASRSETPGIIPPLDLADLADIGGCVAKWQARRAPAALSGACLRSDSEPTALTLLVLAGPHLAA